MWGKSHFLNEARALERLHHWNLVRGHRLIDDVVDVRRIICLVMEYGGRRTLAEELKEGPLAEARVRTRLGR